MAVPLLYNPRAGAGRGEAVARRATRLLERAGVEVEARPTRAAGEMAALAARAAAEGAPTILVLGGDGTHGEAADAVLRHPDPPALGLLPSGTGNDLLHAFGLARLDDAVARIARAEPRRIDVGVARWAGGERRFLSVFGTGFMADVSALANRRLKALGRASYTVAVPFVLARLAAVPTRVVLDGRVLEDDLPLVAVCNTAYAGGMMRFAPAASATDGMLDVLALRGARGGRVLRLLPKLRQGSHVGEPDVLVERARRIVIEPRSPQLLLADGETLGSTPVTVDVEPGALRAFV